MFSCPTPTRSPLLLHGLLHVEEGRHLDKGTAAAAAAVVGLDLDGLELNRLEKVDNVVLRGLKGQAAQAQDVALGVGVLLPLFDNVSSLERGGWVVWRL